MNLTPNNICEKLGGQESYFGPAYAALCVAADSAAHTKAILTSAGYLAKTGSFDQSVVPPKHATTVFEAMAELVPLLGDVDGLAAVVQAHLTKLQDPNPEETITFLSGATPEQQQAFLDDWAIEIPGAWRRY